MTSTSREDYQSKAMKILVVNTGNLSIELDALNEQGMLLANHSTWAEVATSAVTALDKPPKSFLEALEGNTDPGVPFTEEAPHA
jgi:hypothetical protein